MKQKINKIFILMIILFFAVPFQWTNAQNEKFKALFIYNFTKLIMWPDTTSANNFIITIFGSSPPLQNELELIAKKKTVNGQIIQIKKTTSIHRIGDCHILFIPNYNCSKLPEVREILESKPTIIITDNYANAKQGSDINFVKVNNYLNYEIYRFNILRAAIKINPKLFKLGTEINE